MDTVQDFEELLERSAARCLVIGGLAYAFFRTAVCPYCSKEHTVSVLDENTECDKCRVLVVIIWT